MTNGRDAIRASYDAVSHAYADRFRRELDHKPFDRYVLRCFAETVRGSGPVADIGCGPGQITRFLSDCGLEMRGIDLSQEMVARARAENPDILFSVGDMRHLDIANDTFSGISAFYSIIHIARAEVTATLSEFLRTLKSGGYLLLTCHLGSKTIHLDEWFDVEVDVDFHFFERVELERYLNDAGFDVLEAHERDPYPDVEANTRRAYILAAKP